MQYPKIPLHGALIGFFAAFVLLYSARSMTEYTTLQAQVVPPASSSSSDDIWTDDGFWDGGGAGSSSSMSSISNSNGSVSSDSSGTFATCAGYDQTYRVDMTLPENKTHLQEWEKQFNDSFTPIRAQLNGLQNGVDCSQTLRGANERFAQLVQKYRCALADETMTGVLGSLAVLSRQSWAKDPEGTINIMKLMNYMNEVSVQLQQANNVTNSMERYVQSFRCDVNVTLPSDLVIRLQGSSSSSSSSSSDENYDDDMFDEPPPADEPPPEENPWDWGGDGGGGNWVEPPVDDGGGGGADWEL